MKFIKYSKYSGEDFGIDAQDLLKALSDFLLQSGFQAQFSEWNSNDLEGSPHRHRALWPLASRHAAHHASSLSPMYR